jgi:hypothetical protein
MRQIGRDGQERGFDRGGSRKRRRHVGRGGRRHLSVSYVPEWEIRTWGWSKTRWQGWLTMEGIPETKDNGGRGREDKRLLSARAHIALGVKGAYVLLLVTSISTIVGGVGAGDFLATYELGG